MRDSKKEQHYVIISSHTEKGRILANFVAKNSKPMIINDITSEKFTATDIEAMKENTKPPKQKRYGILE